MKHRRNKQQSKRMQTGIWQVIPCIIMMAVIPLLIRAKRYYIGLEQFPWFQNERERVELFLVIKQQAIITMAVIMFLIISYYFINAFLSNQSKYSDGFLKENGSWRWERAFYPLAAYMLLAILSTVFSPNAAYGYRGAHEQFESLFVLLAYGIMVVYTYWTLTTEKKVKALEIGFLVGVSLLCGLGLLQITGNDLFRTTFGARLILPKQFFESSGGRLSFTFGLNHVYLSLYNPNYVGMYVSLVIPVIASLFITNRNPKMRIWYGLLIAGLLLCLIGSGSKTAFVTLIFSALLLLIFFRRKLLQNKIITVIGLAMAVAFVVGVVLFMGNSFFDRLKASLQFTGNPEHALSALTTEGEKIALTYKGESAELVADSTADGGFRLQTPQGQEIESIYFDEVQAYRFNNSAFAEIPLLITDRSDEQTEIQWQIAGIAWDFVYRENQFFYKTPVGKEDQLVDNIEKGLFQNQESFATHRGYIWSRTFPLLKKYIFLGSGADTFTLVFPQNDYLGKSHNNFHNTIITKPHNLYLQIAVQTGVLSMFAVLAFYFLYFIAGIKLYWKNNFESYFSKVGAAVFIGTIGYMVSSVFNDSTITVAPVFWVLMGIGFAMNHQVKKEIAGSEKVL